MDSVPLDNSNSEVREQKIRQTDNVARGALFFDL